MTDKAPNSWPLATPLASTDSFLINFGDDGATPGAGNPRRLRASTLTAFLATATLAAGTITTSQPLTLTQTWNAGGVTFTGLLANITDTASAAGSLLADLQVAGVSKFNVTKAGVETLAGSFTITPNPTGYAGGPLFVFNETVNGYTAIQAYRIIDTNGAVRIGDTGGVAGVRLANTAALMFGSSITTAGSIDLFLVRDAANTLTQRNGANAQRFNLYGTFTDASNYERAEFDWATTANLFRIRATAAGTGTVRGIAIDAISKAGAAANTDIPAGTWALLRDTSGATTKLIYNNGGTIMSVALT